MLHIYFLNKVTNFYCLTYFDLSEEKIQIFLSTRYFRPEDRIDWFPSLIYREETGDHALPLWPGIYGLHTEHLGLFTQGIPDNMAYISYNPQASIQKIII